MEKLNQKIKINLAAGAKMKMNKSMMFTSALCVGVFDNLVANIFNGVSNMILSENPNPKYEHNMFSVNSSVVRLGNGYNKSSMSFW